MAGSTRTITVGVTGGIGSGKTEACKVFESLGAKVYYADPIAKQLMNSNQGIRNRIQRAFGDDMYLPDATLDRKRLAKVIFADPGAQKTIEKIVHPPVLEYLKQELIAAKRDGTVPVVMVEAAILFEAGAENLFDYTLMVEADTETRLARLLARDNISRADVLERMNAQLPTPEKTERADFVIQNTGDLPSLGGKCRFFYTLLLHLAGQS